MRQKKHQKLLRKAVRHSAKVVMRCEQINAQPELDDALNLNAALIRREREYGYRK